MNGIVTAQVEVWRGKKEKDKVDFKQIIEQQKGEWKEEEKEVVKVMQTDERLLRAVTEEKGVEQCMESRETISL